MIPFSTFHTLNNFLKVCVSNVKYTIFMDDEIEEYEEKTNLEPEEDVESLCGDESIIDEVNMKSNDIEQFINEK